MYLLETGPVKNNFSPESNPRRGHSAHDAGVFGIKSNRREHRRHSLRSAHTGWKKIVKYQSNRIQVFPMCLLGHVLEALSLMAAFPAVQSQKSKDLNIPCYGSPSEEHTPVRGCSALAALGKAQLFPNSQGLTPSF